MVMIKCSGLEKKKEKNKMLKAKVISIGALVWWLRHLASVIIFRIDGRTIKRGALIEQFNHLVPLGVGKLAFAF